MHTLVQIVGQSVASDSARSALSLYSPLVVEVQDLAPDEGLPKDFYLSNNQAGICIKHEEDGEITTIFLHSEGHEGYSGFQGDLGHGLSFSSSPEAVRNALGSPAFYREGGSISGLGEYGEVFRYDYPSHSIHLQFAVGSKKLELVTLMAPTAVPG